MSMMLTIMTMMMVAMSINESLGKKMWKEIAGIVPSAEKGYTGSFFPLRDFYIDTDYIDKLVFDEVKIFIFFKTRFVLLL